MRRGNQLPLRAFHAPYLGTQIDSGEGHYLFHAFSGKSSLTRRLYAELKLYHQEHRDQSKTMTLPRLAETVY